MPMLDWERDEAEADPGVVEEPHVSGVKRERDEGCWRMQKTNVLLITRR